MENTYTYISVAETAKLLRESLKKAFPGVKFGVRSKSYSGGASITVYWTDGPKAKAVDAVCGQFTGADFDGMIDLKTHNSSWLMPDGSAIVARAQGTTGSRGVIPGQENAKPHPDAKLVHFGADFIFTSHSHSELEMLKASLAVSDKYGLPPANVISEPGSSPYIGGENARLNVYSHYDQRDVIHMFLEGRE